MRTFVGIACGLLMVGALHAQTPIGDEFQVNSYTTDNQNRPDVGVDSSSNFVVVWASQGSGGSDASGYSVQGQRFDSGGNPLGGEFQVNSYTTGSQLRPAVAADAGGDFIVVWQSDGSSGSDSSGSSIQGQRFDSGGNPLSSEFQINASTSGPQSNPDVAVDSVGDFVVVWSDNYASGSESVRGQRFDSGATPIGNEFQISADLATPAVASFAGGGFVVVWSDLDFVIHGQRFDSAGNPVGSQLKVNTMFGDFFIAPDVAAASDNAFLVVWDFTADLFTGTNSVAGQRFDSAGNHVGSQFQVNSYTGKNNPYSVNVSSPAVAVDATGEFIVVWSSNGSPGSDTSLWSIQGQRLGAEGNQIGDQFQVNSYTTGSQRSSAVATAPDGDFIAVWSSDGSSGSDSSGSSIQGQRFDSSLIFTDGFESGDTSVWSATKP